MHFVWGTVLDSYFPTDPSRNPSPAGQAVFPDFFRVLVDGELSASYVGRANDVSIESLFSNTSSSERKFWGFQVVERVLPILPSDLLPQIFTPNFMRCWINNLSSSDRYLHKAAGQIARSVQDIVKTNPAVGFTLLAALVGKHGRPDFDRVTKTKTVESIMGSLSVEGIVEYVQYLQKVVLGTDAETR